MGEVWDEGMLWWVARKWPVSIRHPEEDDIFQSLMCLKVPGLWLVSRVWGHG